MKMSVIRHVLQAGIYTNLMKSVMKPCVEITMEGKKEQEVRITMWKRIRKTAVILLCIACLLAGKSEYTVWAKTEEPMDCFSGDVTVLKPENNGYAMQVTVENSGADFTGTVQVVFAGADYVNTAYSTKITLPAQGKKQFAINVSGAAVDTESGICAIHFLDEEENVLQSIELEDLFGRAATELSVGVLSENYDGLDFMEADGEYIDFHNIYYPLKLSELSGDALEDKLDGYYFLIIDQFDVSSLSGEDIEAVQDWVKAGGWLMIGTGAYAKQTLSGFDRDFMDVSVLSVSEPGEENYLSDHALNGYYDYYYDRDEDYYYLFNDEGIDFTNMAVADLDYNRSGQRSFYDSSDYPAMLADVGDGSVMILYFSLGEEELRKLGSYTVLSMYEKLISESLSYRYDIYSEWDYVNEEAISLIDSLGTDVNFTGLKIMIAVYVVLVGPVLYLILRRAKKREWYWICAPVLGLIFIAGVYILGRDVRVSDAMIYSVTAQRVDGNRKNTYFLAYHSGTDPWTVRLDGKYEMAGPGYPGWNGYYYGGNYSTDEYKYIVDNDADGLLAGIKPEENFESGFFYAEGGTESRGAITCENLEYIRRGKMKGTVTNETDCDMAYMAVWFEDNVIVFSDVKAGEAIDLDGDSGNTRRVYEDTTDNGARSMMNRMLDIYSYSSNPKYDQADMAALLVGMGIAENENSENPAGTKRAIVIGVTEDYDRVTAGRCGGLSYGCLYTFAEMEGGGQQKDSGFNPHAFF